VAPAYNPSYSGGRDLVDRGLKSTQARVHENLFQKEPFKKKKKDCSVILD
jgi:hypothetical protein